MQEDKIRQFFDDRAEWFDNLYDDRSFLNRTLRKSLHVGASIAVQECAKVEDCRVLDIGCGSGRNIVRFVREAGAKQVTGIDISESMLTRARKLISDCGYDNRCELIPGDFRNLPLATTYDVGVALGVFDYLAEPVAFLSKMIHVCTKRALFSVPRWSVVRMPMRVIHHHLFGLRVYNYSVAALQRLCKAAGATTFQIVPSASSTVVVIVECQQRRTMSFGVPLQSRLEPTLLTASGQLSSKGLSTSKEE